MAIFIPELALYKIIRGCLQHVRNDYAEKSDKTQTILHYVFGGQTIDNRDYLKDAVALLTRDKQDNRFVEVRQFFDASRAKIPTIHITIPQDENGENSIGVNQQDQYEGGSFDVTINEGTTRISNNGRRFDTQYHLICTSDNYSETLILYHLLRAVLISVFDTIQHAGLENPVLSGQELRIKEELSPPHIYMRALGLRASYEVEVPQWFGEKVIEKFFIEPKFIDNEHEEG